jgi:hypothetical protein
LPIGTISKKNPQSECLGFWWADFKIGYILINGQKFQALLNERGEPLYQQVFGLI